VRLVVTGAAGGLGRAFLQQVPAHHQIHAFTHDELDVGDRDAVAQTIPLLRPDAIVHLAALTQVDACETNPARATRDNALGAQHVALAAQACGAAMLHVSTDYVFDGMKGVPYDEMDVPHPISEYGRTKLAGEGFVRHLVPEHFIVRTSYVYGAGDDYASGAVERLRRGESAGGIRDRIGSPTFVRHLADRILPLLLTGRFGTYHLAGSEPACWFDVLERARVIGRLPGTVEPQEMASLGLVAARPANSALVSAYLEHIGIEPLPDLDEAVAEWIGSASDGIAARGSAGDSTGDSS
jgi:dTDP-4-dehydrorhamnose reductase